MTYKDKLDIAEDNLAAYVHDVSKKRRDAKESLDFSEDNCHYSMNVEWKWGLLLNILARPSLKLSSSVEDQPTHEPMIKFKGKMSGHHFIPFKLKNQESRFYGLEKTIIYDRPFRGITRP